VKAYDKFDVAEQRREAEFKQRRRDGNDRSNGRDDRDRRPVETADAELPVNHEQGL
jgi:hypothetical protein